MKRLIANLMFVIAWVIIPTCYKESGGYTMLAYIATAIIFAIALWTINDISLVSRLKEMIPYPFIILLYELVFPAPAINPYVHSGIENTASALCYVIMFFAIFIWIFWLPFNEKVFICGDHPVDNYSDYFKGKHLNPKEKPNEKNTKSNTDNDSDNT